MKNEIVLRFTIGDFDDISHNEISKLLDRKPSKVYIKGERRNPKSEAIIKSNRWLLDASTDRHEPFETQLGSLLRFLESKKEVIKNFALKYSCEISCAIFIYFDNGESTPSVNIPAKDGKFLGELNLDIDFDLYCLPND